MKQFAKVIIVFIALFIYICTNSATAASIQQGETGKCSLKLSGEIDILTNTDLANAYKSLNDGKPEKCGTPMLSLNSSGGDVGVAIRAGDFIRLKKFYTEVAPNASCASACVLLFLGGVDRMPAGQIGLHRPYSQSYSTSESDARNTYESINSQIRQYLYRMNIPEDVLTKMNSVSPGEIKWLNCARDEDCLQLQELRIMGKDPVFEDQEDSGKAKQIGISKQEYYLRQQRAEAICPSLTYSPGDNRQEFSERGEKRVKCYWDVMYGRK